MSLYPVRGRVLLEDSVSGKIKICLWDVKDH